MGGPKRPRRRRHGAYPQIRSGGGSGEAHVLEPLQGARGAVKGCWNAGRAGQVLPAVHGTMFPLPPATLRSPPWGGPHVANSLGSLRALVLTTAALLLVFGHLSAPRQPQVLVSTL